MASSPVEQSPAGYTPTEHIPVTNIPEDADNSVETHPAESLDNDYRHDPYRDEKFGEVAPGALAALNYPDTALREADDSSPVDTAPGGYEAIDDGAHTAPRPAAQRRRKRRRRAMAIVLTCMVLLAVGVGYAGLKMSGLLDSRKDYSNATGTADVLVDIPDNSTIKDIGEILASDDVVGSVRAFVDAADGASMSAGFYKMRTQVPAATAVQMITDSDSTHRVGRIVVPEGLQLDTKRDAGGRVKPGIFQMIADQTAVEVNGKRIGVTVDQLQTAAADGTVSELGVPSWAREAVEGLDGDHRRIEGLIAPGTWESINPNLSATQMLNYLITQSAQRFEGWGLLSQNSSGITPYQTLVAASLVEGEVNQADDYAKVARVILNRLAKGQRLEFDSTANYTADVTDIDVHTNVLKADNAWNTYVKQGLPPTPIGAVGQRALQAMEQPAAGNWLYFVTVDSAGTTLFTESFDQHRRNIGRACANKFITCN